MRRRFVHRVSAAAAGSTTTLPAASSSSSVTLFVAGGISTPRRALYSGTATLRLQATTNNDAEDAHITESSNYAPPSDLDQHDRHSGSAYDGYGDDADNDPWAPPPPTSSADLIPNGQQASAEGETEPVGVSGLTPSKAEAVVLPPHVAECNAAVAKILEECVPVIGTEENKELLRQAKSAKEIRQILETVVYRHPLCFDLLNGHGYRVATMMTLTSAAPRCNALDEWFGCLSLFRRYGFELTRSYLAEGFNLLRSSISNIFQTEGRSPSIIIEGLNRSRQLIQWALEDRLVLDHVVYTRALFLATMMVSLLDRQNVFRASFSPDFSRRDGVVQEWVLGPERSVDYDAAVQLCTVFVDELMDDMRKRILSRPAFSVLYRLMDFYFAADQPEKMIAVLEDAQSYGVNVAESSTAKIMQLATAFNLPNVPDLFVRLRALPPQCVIAAPDMSRLLFYYGRGGGGKPCPACGEPYNHRHAGDHIWNATPPAQRGCPLLQLARLRKSVLEDFHSPKSLRSIEAHLNDHQAAGNEFQQQMQQWYQSWVDTHIVAQGRSKDTYVVPPPPQCGDHSDIAFSLWNMSKSRAIRWSALEWRGFLLCCIHSPRALEALQLVTESLPEIEFDEFLRQAYLRLLRHHDPASIVDVLNKWSRSRDGGSSSSSSSDSTERPLLVSKRLSPIVLQEALMGVLLIPGRALRAEVTRLVWDAIVGRDSYLMPYTKRWILRIAWEAQQHFPEQQQQQPPRARAAATQRSLGVIPLGTEQYSAEELQFLTTVVAPFRPRIVHLLDLKDGVSDFVMGSTKKNVYIASSREREARDLREVDKGAERQRRRGA